MWKKSSMYSRKYLWMKECTEGHTEEEKGTEGRDEAEKEIHVGKGSAYRRKFLQKKGST